MRTQLLTCLLLVVFISSDGYARTSTKPICTSAIRLDTSSNPTRTSTTLPGMATPQPPGSTPPIEPGVSLQLARQRALVLKHIRYRIHFRLPSDSKTPVAGAETIYFDCLDNSVPLQIDFKGRPDQLIEIQVNGIKIPVRFELEHIIIAPRYLHKGADNVQIRFIAGDRPLNRNKDYCYTLLVPDRARALFPCFDQPDLKAVFTLTLTLPNDWTAVANAPLKDSTPNLNSNLLSNLHSNPPNPDRLAKSFSPTLSLNPPSADANSKTLHFLPSDKFSTYLFSFAAGKFFQASGRMNGKIVHAYYRETDSSKIRLSLDSLFRIQDQALTFLQEYTQIPYPFQKFGFVAIPDFQFGGMEHPGAIQYQASSLFLDESATNEQFNSRSNLLSHETSHMWFGDLVTMRWFNDVWMKEVFANFMADKIGNITRPGGDFQLKFLTSHFPAAYNTDRTTGANPIRQTLDNLQDAGSLYGNIIYNKAPIMMQQLELLMGETPFRNGLREYLKTFAYANASWPDLIRILGKYTKSNLNAWNEVWVNGTGRPRIGYSIQVTHDTITSEKSSNHNPSGDQATNDKVSTNKITHLTLTQQGEDGSRRIWPQVIELAFVYVNHTDRYTVNMNSDSVTCPQTDGKPAPLYILFNSSGKGYGLFPIDTQGITQIPSLTDPVMRASAYINLYENMLDGHTLTPNNLLLQDQHYLKKESKELVLTVLLAQINSLFWHFTTPADRAIAAPGLENTIWETMQQAAEPNVKKLLFLTYAGIALTHPAQDTIFKVWSSKIPPAGVKLSEEDYTGLAAGLAIRNYPGYQQIIQTQTARIQNPDRRARFQYLQPSLSADQAVRDSFFMSLRDRKNREKEAWVLSALGNLHHPLRTASSEKYLSASLDWLEEIQKTGDIFFPERWLQASFGNYQSPSVARLVSHFLAGHPDYNPKLKEKILQTTDNLFRAQKLLDLQ